MTLTPWRIVERRPPTDALESSSPGPRLNEAACTGCLLCREFCLKDAIRIYPKGIVVNGRG